MLALSLGILWLTPPKMYGNLAELLQWPTTREQMWSTQTKVTVSSRSPACTQSFQLCFPFSLDAFFMLFNFSAVLFYYYYSLICCIPTAVFSPSSLPCSPSHPPSPLHLSFLFPFKKRARDRTQTWHSKMQYLAHTSKPRLDETTQYILSYSLRISQKVSDLTTKFGVFLFPNLCRLGSLSLSHPKVLFYFGLHLSYFGALFFLSSFLICSGVWWPLRPLTPSMFWGFILHLNYFLNLFFEKSFIFHKSLLEVCSLIFICYLIQKSFNLPPFLYITV